MPTDEVIGVRRRRVDGEAKVRGATRFAADPPLHGLLHGRLVLAADAHAAIAGIDASGALEVPGVVAVLTAADLPIGAGATGRVAEPLAREEIVYSGQPVALVLAEGEAAAADGVDAVVVETEPLPAVLDIEAATAEGAPAVRVGARGAGTDLAGAHAESGAGDDASAEQTGNVVGRRRMAAGADGTAADVTAAGRFSTSWIYQAYLEPQSATAWLDPEGDLVVSSSTQGAFGARKRLADALGLSHDRVRMRPAPLGGGFGGKIILLEPLVASAALLLRRPVRLTLTRVEDFAASNPAPGQVLELSAGAARDGSLAAIRGRVVVDRGANDEFALENLSALLAAGPYRWRARDIEAVGVLTNRVPFGSYRAPGAPPAAFAIESLVDELAAELGLDPLEMRLRNALSEGEPGPDGKPLPVFGGRECLERVRSHPLWRSRGAVPDDEGVGLALGWWPGGLEPAAASCRLDADGGLTIVTGAVDMTGTETVFGAIAAQAFGLPVDRVRVVAADTAGAMYAGVSSGSKVTYTVGRAVQDAATEARERLLEVAASELEIAAEDLEIADGSVGPLGAPGRAIPIADLASRVLSFGSPYPPVEGHGRIAQTSRAPSAAAHVAHVRVDRDTGDVVLLRHVIAQDVGRALNPALVEGQQLGGVTQGIGWALMEGLVYDADGQLRTGSFAEYAVPTVDRVPPIDTEIVEVPAPGGPFGAKGVGEVPVIAAAAAIANAIAAATGVRLRALPMSPERVWRALRDA